MVIAPNNTAPKVPGTSKLLHHDMVMIIGHPSSVSHRVDSACGLAEQNGGFNFYKGGLEGVLQILGDHTAEPPRESFCQGADKEALDDCQTLDSGGTI